MENSEKRSVKLSKNKHIDLFIILFVVAIVIASVFIILNAVGVLTDGTGYVALELTSDSEVNYNNGIECYVYFKGNTYTVNSNKAKAGKLYSTAKKKIYMLTDAYNNYYPFARSVWSINHSIGEDVEIDGDLYDILLDAHNKSSLDDNYSIFAAPLYDEWGHLLYAGALIDNENDPLINSEEQSFIDDLINIIKDTSNYSLTFKDNNIVNLSISETYKTFRSTYGIDGPVISLNILDEAYQMQYLTNYLQEEGYLDGYIYDTYGNGITFQNFQGMSHNLFDIVDGKAHLFGTVSKNGHYAFSTQSRFLTNTANNVEYYDIVDADITYHRSRYLNLNSGNPNNYYLSTTLFSARDSLVDLTLENNKMAAINDSGEENNYLSNRTNDYEYLILKNIEEKRLFITDSLNGSMTIYKNDYNFDII